MLEILILWNNYHRKFYPYLKKGVIMPSELVFYDSAGKPIYAEDCNRLVESTNFEYLPESEETEELDPSKDLS